MLLVLVSQPMFQNNFFKATTSFILGMLNRPGLALKKIQVHCIPGLDQLYY